MAAGGMTPEMSMSKVDEEKELLEEARAGLGNAAASLLLQERELLRLELEAALGAQRKMRAELDAIADAAGRRSLEEEDHPTAGLDALLVRPLEPLALEASEDAGQTYRLDGYGGLGGVMDLWGGKIAPGALLPLAAHYSELDHLQTVDLGRSNLTESAAAAIGVLLTHRPALRALSLAENSAMGPLVAQAIAEGLDKAVDLRYLELFGCTFDPDGSKGDIAAAGADIVGGGAVGVADWLVRARQAAEIGAKARGDILEAAILRHGKLVHLGMCLVDLDKAPVLEYVVAGVLRGGGDKGAKKSSSPKRGRSKSPKRVARGRSVSGSGKASVPKKKTATPGLAVSGFESRTDAINDVGGSWHLARLLHRKAANEVEIESELLRQRKGETDEVDLSRSVPSNGVTSLNLSGSSLCTLGWKALFCGLVEVLGEEAANIVIGHGITSGSSGDAKKGKSTRKKSIRSSSRSKKSSLSSGTPKKRSTSSPKKRKKKAPSTPSAPPEIQISAEEVMTVTAMARARRPLRVSRLDVSNTFAGGRLLHAIQLGVECGHLCNLQNLNISHTDAGFPPLLSLLQTLSSSSKPIIDRLIARGNSTVGAHSGDIMESFVKSLPPCLRILDVSGCWDEYAQAYLLDQLYGSGQHDRSLSDQKTRYFLGQHDSKSLSAPLHQKTTYFLGQHDSKSLSAPPHQKTTSSNLLSIAGDGMQSSVEMLAALASSNFLEDNPPLFLHLSGAESSSIRHLAPHLAPAALTHLHSHCNPSATPTQHHHPPSSSSLSKKYASVLPSLPLFFSGRGDRFSGGGDGDRFSGGGDGDREIPHHQKISPHHQKISPHQKTAIELWCHSLGVDAPSSETLLNGSVLAAEGTISTSFLKEEKEGSVLVDWAQSFAATVQNDDGGDLYDFVPGAFSSRVRLAFVLVRERGSLVLATGVHGTDGGGATARNVARFRALNPDATHQDVSHSTPSFRPVLPTSTSSSTPSKHSSSSIALAWPWAWHAVAIPSHLLCPADILHLKLVLLAAPRVKSDMAAKTAAEKGTQAAKAILQNQLQAVAHTTSIHTPKPVLEHDPFTHTVHFSI